MERKIIVKTNLKDNQGVYTLQSNAETLGQLKQELSNANINYGNAVFYEGLSHTEMKDDSSVLPSNIPFKGGFTNDLAFLLTSPKKEISNGLSERAEVYSQIKAMGLAEGIKAKFGRNFTQVNTEDLKKYILSLSNKTCCNKESNKIETTCCKNETKDEFQKMFLGIVKYLESKGLLKEGWNIPTTSITEGDISSIFD